MRLPILRQRTIRSTVMLLVIACVLPAWLLVAAVTYASYQSERAEALREIEVASRRILRTVENQFDADRATLQALAVSGDIERENLTAFHRQASEVIAHTSGFTIVLTDAAGNQILNLLRPPGAPLPQHGNPEVLQQVLQSGEARVSDVFMSGLTKKPIVTVEAPVTRDGAVRYVLSLGIDLANFGERLRQQELPPDWVVGIFDRRGKFVARSPEGARFVGREAVPALLEAMRRHPEGWLEAPTTEGIPVTGFYTRSARYGWTVATGIPRTALTAGLRKSAGYYVTGLLLLLLGSLALAVALGRRIAGPVQALVAPALALGKGSEVAVSESGMQEPDEVGRALVKAQRLLLQRAVERDQAEEKLALAAKALDSAAEGVVVVQGGRILTVNRAFTAITGYQPEDALGKPLSMLLAESEEAHRDERRRSVLETGVWQGEVLGRRKNGEVYPVWSSISRATYGPGETLLVSVFSDISAAKQYESSLQHLAHYDALTQLPNRVLFRERLTDMLARAERHGNVLALLFIDLDRFKPINDTLGHQAGDELLQRVAERLAACVRASDTIARLGGDEFTVLLDELHSPDEAGIVARNILDALERPYILSGQAQYISASIGIACYPSDSIEAETLLRQADMAMYRAKQEGRNGYRFFAPEFNLQASERLFMANSLRAALEREELKLVFQPSVNLATGKVTGIEALIRWEHPEKGTILPSRFISLAEESGLIEPIGEWVLREAAGRARKWKEAGLFSGRIAVNLSPRQFRRSDLAGRMLAVLAEVGLAPRDLEFEVTEGMVMEHPERAVRVLEELSAAGVSVSIDDFGTGYSSLAYLKRFPVHCLKIDRSFVSGLPEDRSDRSLTRAVVAIAKSLGLSVIAEGVENKAQADFLRWIRCDFAQGHYFSKPLEAEALEAFLRADVARILPADTPPPAATR